MGIADVRFFKYMLNVLPVNVKALKVKGMLVEKKS